MKHHNTGNKYAAKDVTKSSCIQLRCTQEEKAIIVRNLKHNEKLSEFMLSSALREVAKRVQSS